MGFSPFIYRFPHYVLDDGKGKADSKYETYRATKDRQEQGMILFACGGGMIEVQKCVYPGPLKVMVSGNHRNFAENGRCRPQDNLRDSPPQFSGTKTHEISLSFSG
jgi:hypothetical protein